MDAIQTKMWKLNSLNFDEHIARIESQKIIKPTVKITNFELLTPDRPSD